MTAAIIYDGKYAMTPRFGTLLLEIWREVCRHIEIGESVARVAPILAKRLPADFLLVRHLDLNRSCLETVATGECRSAAAELRPRSECAPGAMDSILKWARQEQVLRSPIAQVEAGLPGLLPAGAEGEVLAGPLNSEGRPAGVLLFISHSPCTFSSEHEELLHAWLEPFTIAIENDRRVRELDSLREALEADNRSLLSRLERHDISDSIVGAETGLRPVM